MSVQAAFEYNIKIDQINRARDCGLVSSAWGQDPEEGCYEQSNQSIGSVKAREFLHCLNDC